MGDLSALLADEIDGAEARFAEDDFAAVAGRTVRGRVRRRRRVRAGVSSGAAVAACGALAATWPGLTGGGAQGSWAGGSANPHGSVAPSPGEGDPGTGYVRTFVDPVRNAAITYTVGVAPAWGDPFGCGASLAPGTVSSARVSLGESHTVTLDDDPGEVVTGVDIVVAPRTAPSDGASPVPGDDGPSTPPETVAFDLETGLAVGRDSEAFWVGVVGTDNGVVVRTAASATGSSDAARLRLDPTTGEGDGSGVQQLVVFDPERATTACAGAGSTATLTYYVVVGLASSSGDATHRTVEFAWGPLGD